jgi:hypothetical protein
VGGAGRERERVHLRRRRQRERRRQRRRLPRRQLRQQVEYRPEQRVQAREGQGRFRGYTAGGEHARPAGAARPLRRVTQEGAFADPGLADQQDAFAAAGTQPVDDLVDDVALKPSSLKSELPVPHRRKSTNS